MIQQIQVAYDKARNACELREREAFDMHEIPSYADSKVLARWFYAANEQELREFSELVKKTSSNNMNKAGRNTICSWENRLKADLEKFREKLQRRYR